MVVAAIVSAAKGGDRQDQTPKLEISEKMPDQGVYVSVGLTVSFAFCQSGAMAAAPPDRIPGESGGVFLPSSGMLPVPLPI